MKWATPASSGVSRREPARTYAAMETERAPGQPGADHARPLGSAVRSNIAADGSTDRAGPAAGPGRGRTAGPRMRREVRPAYFGR